MADGDERREEAGSADTAQRSARNDKMLHARIPETLDREIRRRAGSLGMSVSTVVRHVLLNTFNLVEDIVADSADIASALGGGDGGGGVGDGRAGGGSKDGDAPAGAARVVGWHEAVLDLNAVCDHCNVILEAGTRAAIAIFDHAGPRTIICTKCLDDRIKNAAERATTGA